MIIIDNAITDSLLLNEVATNKEVFGKVKNLNYKKPINVCDTDNPYDPVSVYFWDGWVKSPANTVLKRVLEHMWNKFLPMPIEDLYGIEYWTWAVAPNQHMSWHVDRGFCVGEPGGNNVAPKSVIGAVYYPDIGTFETSYLELKFDDGIERIPTKPNRLVIFDAANTYHQTTPTKNNIRYALASNLWSTNNPPTTLDNFHINEEFI